MVCVRTHFFNYLSINIISKWNVIYILGQFIFFIKKLKVINIVQKFLTCVLILKKEQFMAIYLSIIIPVYNEVENIKLLNDQINEALSNHSINYEIIYVDDCSLDDSYNVLQKLAKTDNNVKVIQFKKHKGQTTAMSAGFEHAKGEIIIPLDADLQNDPSDIPMMIEKYKEGYDVVSGWRKNRKDGFFRVFLSKIANDFIAFVSGIKIHDTGCTLKVYNAKFLKNNIIYGEQHRYIPAILGIQGIDIAEVAVNHRPRTFGKSKASYSRIPKVFLDALLILFFRNFLSKPIYLFGGLGLFFLLILFALLFIAVATVFVPLFVLNFSLFVIVETLLLGFSLVMLSIGILAEILIRIYFEKNDKKPYCVKKTLNIE